MGKDREGKFHPGKGKPSGANKSEPEIPSDLPVRHPNRNTSKGSDNSKTEATENKNRNAAFTEEFTKTEPEELLGNLTKDIFIELASYDKPPCVSILLPTHKSGLQVNEQVDQTAFKNALQQAEKILKDRTDQTTIKSMLTPGYDLLKDEKFWYSLSDGLAVYIADGFFKYLKVRAPLIEHVRVNSSFYVSPLVPFMVRREYFYLLDIAKKFPRFYRADALGIEHLMVEEMPSGVDDVVHFEEKEGDKLFRTGGKGGTGSANFHGIGGGKPDEKEHIAIYLEEVDDTIWASHLHRENVPLLLAGQDFLIPIYKSVSDYKNNIWPEALTGNHHQQSDSELYEEAMQVMKPYFDQPLLRALEDYGNKSATELTSTVVGAIIPAAYYSRVSHLFVRKGSCIWGTFDEQENKLEIVENESESVEDLIDKAVIKTIQNGGEVYFLEADQMPAQGELAAIFRY